MFPISRDPPEGGTLFLQGALGSSTRRAFPISRDPPEGGTDGSNRNLEALQTKVSNF